MANTERLTSVEDEKNLEEMIDLEGVPGIEELSEQEEEFGEIEEIGQLKKRPNLKKLRKSKRLKRSEGGEMEGRVEEVEIAEDLEGKAGEKSSIFRDFGIAEEEIEEVEEFEEEEEGDVFQDFDFDVFEQELLKEEPARGFNLLLKKFRFNKKLRFLKRRSSRV
jgi:hypothetical protein